MEEAVDAPEYMFNKSPSNKREYSPHDCVPTTLKSLLQSPIRKSPAHIVEKDGELLCCRNVTRALKPCSCLESCNKPEEHKFVHP